MITKETLGSSDEEILMQMVRLARSGEYMRAGALFDALEKEFPTVGREELVKICQPAIRSMAANL